MTTEATAPTSNVTTLPATVPAVRFAPSADLFSDPAVFEHAQRVAKVFAASKLVPQHMQGNMADCLIALQIARRLNEEPLTVMQQIYIVNGRPGWYTSYMISRVNRAGIFSGPITWDESGEGDALTVTAKAIIAGTGEEIRVSVDMRMAAAEGWTKNSKYKSMPTHMLRWRSAAMLIRLYAPEVMLGMPAVEELETMPRMRDVTPRKSLDEALDDLAAGGQQSTAPATNNTTETNSNTTSPQDNGARNEPAAGQPAPKNTDRSQAASGSGAGAAATTGGDAGGGPATEAQYAVHCRAWLAHATSADDVEAQWKADKSLRNRANVSAEVRDELEAEKKARVAELRGGGAKG